MVCRELLLANKFLTMKCLALFLLTTSSLFGSNGISADTLQPSKPVGAFLRKTDLKSFFFNDHSGEAAGAKETKIRKNTIYFQALGNTPFVGMGYRFRVYEKPDYLVETGLGMGFTPFIGFESGKENTPLFSYSAHSNVVIKTGLIISPVVGFSGLWYGGIENNPRRFSFVPSPSLGFRLGSLNKVALNFMWNSYFYQKQYYEYFELGKRTTSRHFFMAYGPSANIQFSF